MSNLINKRLAMRLGDLEHFKNNVEINTYNYSGSSDPTYMLYYNYDESLNKYQSINIIDGVVSESEIIEYINPMIFGDGFSDSILSLIKTTDSGYLVGGRFTTYSGQTANYIIKLKSDGSIDETFNSGDGFDSYVQTLQQTTDGGYLIGGYFISYQGQTASSIIKLKSDGSIDNTFNSGSGFNDLVQTLQQTTDGGYLVGGDFTSYSGQTANRIIKLKSDGSRDTSFNSGSGFDNYISSLLQTTDSGYLVGGRFTTYSGQTANCIIKLKSDGSRDTSFNSGGGFIGDRSYIYSLLQTTDGRYLIGGNFTSYSGQTANYIIKLKSDGSIDDTFNSGDGFNSNVYSLQQTTDGRYLIGGNFTSYSGQTANRIIKLKSDGSIDDTFNSGDGFNNTVWSLLQTTDSGYLVGGRFTSYSGQTANRIIKLKSDGSINTIIKPLE